MQYGQLESWIDEITTLCKPDKVHYCDGSKAEYDQVCQLLVSQGTFTALNPEVRPNSYLCRSDPADTARVENCTFICSNKQEDAGPTNNWVDPSEMKKKLHQLFKGCMKGRILYVIPYCMGPIGSSLSKFGIELTDSPYVVCSMYLMTRMGTEVFELLKKNDFVPGLHSVGMPLAAGEKDVPWPCNSREKYIVHFPDTKEIWSFGSGYGGNALLGKKCLALRIASVMGRDEGWLAEHMLILSLTNPEGKKIYIAAAFPSACGKTNLAMLKSALPEWKVNTVGDDIAWMKFGEDGQLYAINPEAGFFGVAPGTSQTLNPHAMATLKKNVIFTNVALTERGDVWWEGMTNTPPFHATNWLGQPWTPYSSEKAAQPNSRFTVAASQSPIMDSAWQNPKGVPISAILFGGRRKGVTPLVCEAFNWEHGVFLGASISSETTAANVGKAGQLRHDPFAMLPFCGYNMGDYFQHWFNIKHTHVNPKLPKIFYVNWFRKDQNGQYLWPGFGENIRVLKWIFERITANAEAIETAIGYLPSESSLDVHGLALPSETLTQLIKIDKQEWLKEVEELKKYFLIFKDKLPSALANELAQLEQRLKTFKEI